MQLLPGMSLVMSLTLPTPGLPMNSAWIEVAKVFFFVPFISYLMRWCTISWVPDRAEFDPEQGQPRQGDLLKRRMQVVLRDVSIISLALGSTAVLIGCRSK
ncbi:hypothetical protein FRC02_011694 [Tulasnella sp. 418]|nr:hypothetical protein FRC02_011694 [Tulasnella sp. 418]